MDRSHHIHSACSYIFMYISFYTPYESHIFKNDYQEQEAVLNYVIQFNSNPMTCAVKFDVVMRCGGGSK